ncbi:MAG: DsbA family protein [Pseudomonadota bacterium]|nr:DsbA family protein [Pseudomonadota bacterium]
MTDTPVGRSLNLIALGAACAILGGLGGGLGMLAIQNWRGDRMVHDYIVNHPEVLPEAMDNLHREQDSRQLAGIRSDLEKGWPGAVLGNPNGKQTLIEFTDYACTFCRRSVADIDLLIASRPELKVVVRELPILTPESTDAAKMGLAAAAQGRYAAFHKAMFAIGHPAADTIVDAATAAGLDMARARATIADPATQAEIDRNLEFARKLGLSGTPSWVAGDRLLSGAVGIDGLAQALDGVKR